MPLSQAEIVPYLLGRELVTAQSVVDGDLLITDASRRNRNYKVVSSRSPSYLIKQGAAADGTVTVAREAAIYQQLAGQDTRGELAPFLPRCYGYDADGQILVLELVKDAQDLREFHARRRRFSPRLARAMGKALGTLHRLTRVSSDSGQRDPGHPAWVLSAHRPGHSFMYGSSSAHIQLIKAIQRFPSFCARLDELRASWQADSVIHGDIKWDNFIVPGGSTRGRGTELKLIDWELAGLGDPRWDAGSVFNDYLSFWLNSMPITGETPPDRFMELARYPLAQMQPAMQAFWNAYRDEMQLSPCEEDAWLMRAVQYGGARLIQTAYEYLQQSVQLTGNIICLLQLSWNIMERPAEAAVQLLGIPIGKGGNS